MFNTWSQSAGKLKSLAYITGVYLGDGGVFYNKANRSYIFVLNTIDKDFADYTAMHLENLLGKKPRIYKRPEIPPRKPFYRVEINSKDLFMFLREQSQRKQTIPPYIFKMDKRCRQLALRGMFDSDGWFSKAQNNTYQLGIAKATPYMVDMPQLLKSVGVSCGKLCRLKKKTKDGLPVLRILVNKRSWIRANMKFTAARKQNRVNQYIATSETNTLETKKVKIESTRQ